MTNKPLLSAQIIAALERSEEEARILYHYLIGPEHVFLALAHAPQNDAAARLIRAGYHIENASTDVLNLTGTVPFKDRARANQPTPGSLMRRIVASAEKLAAEQEVVMVTTGHFMRACMTDTDNIPRHILLNASLEPKMVCPAPDHRSYEWLNIGIGERTCIHEGKKEAVYLTPEFAAGGATQIVYHVEIQMTGRSHCRVLTSNDLDSFLTGYATRALLEEYSIIWPRLKLV